MLGSSLVAGFVGGREIDVASVCCGCVVSMAPLVGSVKPVELCALVPNSFVVVALPSVSVGDEGGPSFVGGVVKTFELTVGLF